MEREPKISQESSEKLTEEQLRDWVERIDFKELGFESVDVNQFQLQKPHKQGRYVDALREHLQADDERWNKSQEYMELREVRMSPGYEIKPEQRILVTQLSAYFSEKSLGRGLSIPQSNINKIISETVAALEISIDKGNNLGQLDSEKFDKNAQLRFQDFNEIRQEQSFLRQVLSNPEFLDLCNDLPILLNLVNSRLNFRSASPFIESLLSEPLPRNLDYEFERMLLRGREEGGVIVWMRKATYRNWLNTEDCFYNLKKVPMHQVIQSITGTVVSLNPVTEKNKYLCRNSKLFFEYLIQKDLYKLRENPFLNKEINNIESSIEFYYQTGLVSRLVNEFREYVRLISSERFASVAIKDISVTLNCSESTAGHVYYCAQNITDLILLKNDNAPIRSLSSIQKNPIKRSFKKYVELVKSINENSK